MMQQKMKVQMHMSPVSVTGMLAACMHAKIPGEEFRAAGVCCRDQAHSEAEGAKAERDTAAKAQAAAEEQAAKLLEEKRCYCCPAKWPLITVSAKLIVALTWTGSLHAACMCCSAVGGHGLTSIEIAWVFAPATNSWSDKWAGRIFSLPCRSVEKRAEELNKKLKDLTKEKADTGAAAFPLQHQPMTFLYC